MVFKDAKRCKARCKSTGKQCKNPAVKGFDVCRMHGAHTNGSKRPGRKPGSKKPPGSGRGAERGNTRAMTTGVATLKMPAHMEELRQMYVERYRRAVDSPDPFDIDALERAAGLQAKFAFAVSDPDCPASTLAVIHRTLHKELRALRATRETREQTSTGTSPAEVVGAILAKVAERRQRLEEGRQIQAPRVVPHVQAARPTEAVDDEDDRSGDDDGRRVDDEPWDDDQAEGDCDDGQCEPGDGGDDETGQDDASDDWGWPEG